MFRDFREFTLGEWIVLAGFSALAVAVLIQLIDWSELWYKLRQWFLRLSCRSTRDSAVPSSHVGSSSSGCPCTVREFNGVLIPRGVDEYFQYSRSSIPCLGCVLYNSCTGILCSQCILSDHNRHIAEQYFNCLKQEKENEKMRTFRGLKIPAKVDENYNPCPADNLAPENLVCRRHANERVKCTEIRCDECILHKDHAETADEYFKIKHQDKVEMPIDMSKIDLDHAIYEFGSFLSAPTIRYYVLIRFYTTPVAAELMLQHLPIPSNIFWVQNHDYPARCAVMIPYAQKSGAEACRDDIRQALHRLKQKSEVDDFLNASRACSEGVAFAQDCKSMAEVWDKAVSSSRREYLRFMLSAVRRGECARFNKSGHTDAELDWFNTNVFTVPDSIFQQTFSSINPFKDKED